ncbi:hypothetical protein LAZ67_10001002 [Cordylochernes scorpioides]|uniref:PiggyBac transposable element-derived protein domain-containing protein n=1 Tax=Cordylochernes scorpioides TaxID=51811 RepID=A0ABY6L0E4_9ARAC|nr:hypothetical protein LAZ67_10001002 [Cordylochernes scorpioides]
MSEKYPTSSVLWTERTERLGVSHKQRLVDGKDVLEYPTSTQAESRGRKGHGKDALDIARAATKWNQAKPATVLHPRLYAALKVGRDAPIHSDFSLLGNIQIKRSESQFRAATFTVEIEALKLYFEGTNYSRERDANLTNLHEIKALLGIIYFLGVMQANKLNTDDARDNKLAAVRIILDVFVENCQKHFSSSEYIRVDEKLGSFRRKCNFRQNITSKHNKYGIKIFVLMDSKMFYTCNLEVNSGKTLKVLTMSVTVQVTLWNDGVSQSLAAMLQWGEKNSSLNEFSSIYNG